MQIKLNKRYFGIDFLSYWKFGVRKIILDESDCYFINLGYICIFWGITGEE